MRVREKREEVLRDRVRQRERKKEQKGGKILIEQCKEERHRENTNKGRGEGVE